MDPCCFHFTYTFRWDISGYIGSESECLENQWHAEKDSRIRYFLRMWVYGKFQWKIITTKICYVIIVMYVGAVPLAE